jgi:hypothetical protein
MAAKKITAVKKVPAAKKSAASKKMPAAKKSPVANGVKAEKKSSRDDYIAVRHYIGPDGKRVSEVLDYPEPKRLSKFGEWMRAHPKGILKIIDMRAVMR